ncbi:hypothetical protein [Dactylosporangium salmoneum]|uniref:Cytochrome c biogenesis protein CcdA n=1 Tax=Dactylosporangium salmoneum TaxID=53361 RepID=A0ABN3FCG6_9ACTN
MRTPPDPDPGRVPTRFGLVAAGLGLLALGPCLSVVLIDAVVAAGVGRFGLLAAAALLLALIAAAVGAGRRLAPGHDGARVALAALILVFLVVLAVALRQWLALAGSDSVPLSGWDGGRLAPPGLLAAVVLLLVAAAAFIAGAAAASRRPGPRD